MIDLRQYLKSQRKQIVNFIEAKYIPDDITSQPTFNHIATELQARFTHYDGDSNTIGKIDEAHNVLTMAIICSMYVDGFHKQK